MDSLITVLITSEHCGYCKKFKNDRTELMTSLESKNIKDNLDIAGRVDGKILRYDFDFVLMILKMKKGDFITINFGQNGIANISFCQIEKGKFPLKVNKEDYKGEYIHQTIFELDIKKEKFFSKEVYINKDLSFSNGYEEKGEMKEWDDFIKKTIPIAHLSKYIKHFPIFFCVSQKLWIESLNKDVPLYLQVCGFETKKDEDFGLTTNEPTDRKIKFIDFFKKIVDNIDLLYPSSKERKNEVQKAKVREDIKKKMYEDEDKLTYYLGPKNSYHSYSKD